jgi:hypothetical protein
LLLTTSGSSDPSSGLRATYFDNAMLLPRNEAALAPCGRVDALSALVPLDTSALPCGGPDLFSARWDGAFAPGALAGGGNYDLAVRANVPVRLWVRTWKLVDAWSNGGGAGGGGGSGGSAPPAAAGNESSSTTLLESPWNFTVASNLEYTVRLEALAAAAPAGATAPLPSVQLLWRRHGAGADYEAVPDAALAPTVREPERQRQALQRTLARGWNTWHRASAAAHVHLPSGFGVLLSLQHGGGAPTAPSPLPPTPTPAPAPAPAPPAQCGSYLNNTGCVGNGIPGSAPVDSMAACCALCQAQPRCAVASWNGPVGQGKHRDDSTCNLKFSGLCQAHIEGQTFVRVRPDTAAPTPTPAAALRWDHVDKCADEAQCAVRPGAHAYNGSYTFITQRAPGRALNFTIESAHLDGGGGNELLLLVRANDTGAAAALGEWHVLADASFGFFDCPLHGAGAGAGAASLCGTVDRVSADGASLVARPAGFDKLTARAVAPAAAAAAAPAAGAAPAAAAAGATSAATASSAAAAPSADAPHTLSLAFDAHGLACLVVGGAAAAEVTDTAHCAALMAAAAQRFEEGMDADYPRASATAGQPSNNRNRDVADALRAVVGWNIMWDSRVKVVAPVSRDFGVQPYALWLWYVRYSPLATYELNCCLVLQLTRDSLLYLLAVPGTPTSCPCWQASTAWRWRSRTSSRSHAPPCTATCQASAPPTRWRSIAPSRSSARWWCASTGGAGASRGWWSFSLTTCSCGRTGSATAARWRWTAAAAAAGSSRSAATT